MGLGVKWNVPLPSTGPWGILVDACVCELLNRLYGLNMMRTWQITGLKPRGCDIQHCCHGRFSPSLLLHRAMARRAVDMLQSVAVDALQLAIPLVKLIPVVGDPVAGSLQAALFIVQVKDDVKMKKAQCQRLAERVVTITAAITTELMKADPATLARRENSVVALRGNSHPLH
ncbi:hypothetical protein EDD15DRAFT_1144094 [Pisolithus albus]|nr:hypothetical protein EDD15DRAFT_1144094 [Pisolithus albus]